MTPPFSCNTALLLCLTLMIAMIQKAYCTLESSSTASWDRWLWFMLCPAIGLFLSMFRKWCMDSVLFSVWFPQPVSERKGSAISGLTKAPNPMKKWRACKNAENQGQRHDFLYFTIGITLLLNLFWRTFLLTQYVGVEGQIKHASFP